MLISKKNIRELWDFSLRHCMLLLEVSNHVLNMEFEKVCPSKPAEAHEITVSEDRLTQELYKQKVKTLLYFSF